MAVVGIGKSITELAAESLRDVARFLDKNAEALVGDMDSTYVLDKGLHFEFDVLRRDSIGTVKVSKEHFVMNKTERDEGEDHVRYQDA